MADVDDVLDQPWTRRNELERVRILQRVAGSVSNVALKKAINILAGASEQVLVRYDPHIGRKGND